VSNTLEERLRAYGSAIDSATTADLAERDHEGRRSGRRSASSARRVIVALVVLTVAGVTALAVATTGGRSRTGGTVNEAPSTITTAPLVGLTLTPEQKAQCTPTCPEEGPTLTPQQKALFATWRSEYDPAEVAYVTRNVPGADDASVVATMVYRVACRSTYSALQAAKQDAPDQREAVVDAIMKPALATIEERNWPPGSAAPRIFERFTRLLKSGDFNAVSAQVKVGPGYGQCQDALSHRW
jgi:hypothetical protein